MKSGLLSYLDRWKGYGPINWLCATQHEEILNNIHSFHHDNDSNHWSFMPLGFVLIINWPFMNVMDD